VDLAPSEARLAPSERVELARLVVDVRASPGGAEARARLESSAGYGVLTSAERDVGVGGTVARDLYERRAKGTAVVVAIDERTAERYLESVRARWQAIASAIGAGLEQRMPYVTDDEIAACDAERARMRDVAFVAAADAPAATTLTVVFLGAERALRVSASLAYLDAPIDAAELAALREATIVDFAGFVPDVSRRR